MSNLIPLQGLTHLRFRGPDAERYLNGQVTQQVTGITEGQSRYTFVCDAKGRVLFDGSIHRDAEGYLLSVEGCESDDVFARMDRYLIADDCELSDESEKWVILHELSHNSSVGRTGQPLRNLRTRSLSALRYSERSREPRPRPLFPRLLRKNLRITHGVPRTVDLQGALPAETGIEEHAVSFPQRLLSRPRSDLANEACWKDQSQTRCPSIVERTSDSLPHAFLCRLGKKRSSSKSPLFPTEKTEHGYPALGYLSSRYQEGSELKSSDGMTAIL